MSRAIFSLEFFERTESGAPGRSLGEYFLTLGPTAYKEQFRFRVNVEATFGSGNASVTDFGNDNNTLTLSGEFHLYFAARPPSPSDVGDSLLGVARGQGSIGGAARAVANRALELTEDAALDFAGELAPIGSLVRTGGLELTEFLSLLYFVRRTASAAGGEAVRQIVSELSQTASDRPPSYAEYAIVFHDYGRSRHVEVVIPRDGFTLSRSVEDTNTYKWELSLTVLRDVADAVYNTPSLFESLGRINPQYAIARSIGAIRSLIALPLELSGQLRNYGQAFSQLQGLGGELTRAYDNMRNDFAADGRSFSRGFQSVVTLLRDAAGADAGRSPLERLEMALEERRDRLQELENRAAEFRRRLLEVRLRAEELLNVTYINLIGAPISLEASALEPYADWTAVVEERAYLALLETTYATVQADAEFLRSLTDNQYRVVEAPPGGWGEAAEQFAGTRDLAAAVALYNNVDPTEAPGLRPIRVPFAHSSEIYATLPPEPTTADYLRGNLGEDLALTADRDFAVSPTGDLAVVEGEAALVNGVVDAADTPAGSLPAHPWFGQPIEPGELETTWLRDAYVERFLSMLRADPRVQSARVVEVQADGNVRKFRIALVSINGAVAEFVL